LRSIVRHPAFAVQAEPPDLCRCCSVQTDIWREFTDERFCGRGTAARMDIGKPKPPERTPAAPLIITFKEFFLLRE